MSAAPRRIGIPANGIIFSLLVRPGSYSAAAPPKTRFDIDFMRKRRGSRPRLMRASRYLHANTADKVLENSDALHSFQLGDFYPARTRAYSA